MVVVALAACKPAAESAGAAKSAADAPVAAKSALPVLAKAPAWRLLDPSGQPVTSESLKGKTVVVDFWATWCPPCKEEIPGYIALQKKYADKGLVIVGISLDQAGPAVVKKFVAAQQINYPIVMGDEGIVEAFGGIEAIPTTFLIDAQGQIRHRKMGAVPTEEYEALIRQVL